MKLYKIVDRKAPRYRRAKHRYNLINKDLWAKFVTETGIKLSWEQFKEISQEINTEARNLALENREGVMLPEQMGHLWMGLFPAKERILNEPYARNTGNHATHFSFETFGMQGKIVWEFTRKVRYKVKNHQFWGFIAHRDFKTKASNNFKDNPELYRRINLMIRNTEYYKTLKLNDKLNAERSYLTSESSE